jgi:hypothetical protein
MLGDILTGWNTRNKVECIIFEEIVPKDKDWGTCV